MSLGAVLTVLAVAALVVAIRAQAYGAVSVAIVTALTGIWFWFFATEPWEPRYFVPFGIMAFIFVAPELLTALHGLSRQVKAIVSLVIVAPGLMTAGLLAMPAPPLRLQSALGINLTTNLFKEETAQAHALLQQLRDEGVARSSAYIFNISMPQRAFQAVLNYVNLIDPSSPTNQHRFTY